MIIQNPDFLVDLAILEDELMKVDLKDVQMYQKMNHLSGEGRKEMFYLTTHSTHFIYGYMASDMVKYHTDR